MRQAIKAVLIDLSGTLHIEDVAISGAVEALKKLRSSGLKLKFVTNTTKESAQRLWNRLHSLGFSLSQDEIFSSLTAAKRLVTAQQLRPMLFLEDEAMEDFTDVKQEDPNAVVIGLAPKMFTFDHLNKAFNLLMRGDVPLIAINKSRYYKRKDGLALGPGPFVTALEFATDLEAVVVGKPKAEFFRGALASLGMEDLRPEDAVMIGDDVRDDIGGAQNAGLFGILVKTGKYKEKDETKISPPPGFVADDFPQAVDYLLRSMQK